MRKSTCRQQVIDFIKDMILAGEIKAGDRIKEAYIAAATGLSRVPVREALVELCQEGLLQFEPNKGASVIKPTAEDLSTSYEVCGLLEGYLAATSLPLYTRNDFAVLEEVLAQMRTVQNSSRDLKALSDLDFKFHDLIISVSDNPLLINFARIHNAKFEHFFFFPYGEEAFGVDALYERHLEVYESLKSNDAYTVETTMRRHYADCARRTAKYAAML